jgi:flagellar hook-associated protein 3 FlgL
MRITQNTIFNNLRSQMLNNSDRLMKAQETVATQKRFNRLSENPIDGSRVMDLNSSITRSEQYLGNVSRVKAQANTYDSTLNQVNTMIGRAKELLLGEANQATSTATTRESARIEVAHLTTQMVQAANTRFDGKYIFSGFATDTAAYTDASVSATPAAIAGRGAITQQKVADAAQMVYHTYQIQFTGAGQFDILDTTAGTTVASNQTYTSGATIQFNGIQLTLADSPAAPQAGDNYTINTAQPGVYQGDSQYQLAEIQPGTKVQQNIPGNRVFSGVGQASGVDIFSILNQVNDALRTNDRTAISNLLGQLDTAQQQISSERSSIGGRINLLDTVKNRQSDVQTNLETLRSQLEDIDIADAMTQLSKQQNLYEATLSAGSQIVQPSLLDFLR